MKSLAIGLVALALATPVSCQTSNSAVPELVLAPDEIRELPAQTWQFSRVIIPKGSILKITPSSADGLKLIVKGNFDLHGVVEATQWSSEPQTYQYSLPDGRVININVTNTNRGGDGGSGGSVGGGIGGAGALGTPDYGGGGGASGGNNWGVRPKGPWNGPAGEQYRGGSRVGHCGNAGGNGAERNAFGNGGVLYIQVDGNFDGAGGGFMLAGTSGSAGQPGGRYQNSSVCTGGASGGGGGAPGGQGGSLVVYVKGDIVAYPLLNLSGGAGGPSSGGTVQGTFGRAGKTGQVQWFTPAKAEE